MNDFTQLNVEEFLNRLADRNPTPGGGSVTALSGSLACALARMVVAYSVSTKTDADARKRIEQVRSKLHRADELLRALITEDAVRYTRMTEAAKAAKADPSSKPAHQEAVLAAIAVPMEVAALASNVLDILDDFSAHANQYLLSDLGVAAVLAEATACAARYTVRVNVRRLADAQARSKINSEIERIVQHCARKCEFIETYVRGRLQDDLAS